MNAKPVRALLIALAASLLAPVPAARAGEGVLSLAFDNDLFANTDRHYTNGIRLSCVGVGLACFVAGRAVPSWLDEALDDFPLFARGGERRYGWALGQSMYTPADIEAPVPDPADRPYAGWLFASLGVASRLENRLDVLELDLGVVGPSASAGETQIFVHKLSDARSPNGWRHQLRDEPGVLLSYQRKWRRKLEGLPPGLDLDVMPHLGGDVGNVLTQALAGATLRVGFHLPKDFGPLRTGLSPTVASYYEPVPNLAYYLFAGVEGRAVARNIFLDGNSFRDGPSVDKRPLVGEFHFGIAVTAGRLRLAYTHVYSSEEFRNQTGRDSFGALSLSARFSY